MYKVYLQTNKANWKHTISYRESDSKGVSLDGSDYLRKEIWKSNGVICALVKKLIQS